MENRMALDLFIGICGALCLIVGASILLGKLVMWIQKKLSLRREEKELGRIVQQQKRWENLEKELEKLDDSSAIDMASDPKPWAANPVLSTRREAFGREKIIETPNTMWCPECGSEKRYLAHAVGGIPYFKCDNCGQCFKQAQQVRWDRNAVEASPAAPTSEELKALWDSGAMNPTTFESDVVFTDYSGNQASLRVIDDIGPFGGGDFGGSGAGDSYDSSGDSDSSSTDSSSSSDYSSSNDD